MIPTATPTIATPAVDLGKVAYLKEGDLWVKVLPTGEPQRLTTDGQNHSPLWSPSGQWLTFRKEQQVWIIQADGSAPRLLDNGAVVGAFVWAPTTDRLAYATSRGELRITSPDSPDPITLLPQSEPKQNPGQVGRIVWSPDEEWIAYGWQQRQADGSLTYQGLWQISVDGRKRVELHNSGAPERGVALLAGWSPTGERVLFWQGDILSASLLADGAPLYTIKAGQDLADDNPPTRLGTERMLLYADFLAPAPPQSVWGADDVVALAAGEGREAWTNKRLEIAERPLTPETVVATSPAWSPDGQYIAYVAMPDRGHLLEEGVPAIRQALMERHIWINNVSGNTQPRQLTNDAGYRDEWPLWSADGSHILFTRLDSQDRASLWLIPAEGGEPQQVVEELPPPSDWFDYYGHLDWSQRFDWWRG
jgi:Tol biopolymer transport system component